MWRRIIRLFLGLTIVLLILGPLTSARSAHAATWPIEQRSASIAAVQAALAVTPSAINRGGVVVVSGAGFARDETVVLLVSGTRAAVAARADAHGLLPATGVAIPYALAAGTHTITAIGERSKRRATATITVQQLTPTISLSAPAVSPGGSETVTGHGFAVRERVTLSLDGEALATTPSPIITSNGAFTARFTAPSSLRRGANTVSAIGNQSRVSAAAALTGNLVSRTQAYQPIRKVVVMVN